MLYAFAVATILIALAELGDKTQLLALGLAAKYKTWQVVLGVLSAILVLQLVATVAGQLVGNILPDTWLAVITGVLFIGFGVWTIRGGAEDTEEEASRGSRYGAVLTVAVAFFLAELGDKTQIMTMTLAADPAAVLRAFGGVGPAIESFLTESGIDAGALDARQVFWGVWLGSTLGMLLANSIAIVAGSMLGRRLPEKLIARISGSIFIAFGVLSLASVLFR